MSSDQELLEQLRPLAFRIAYRMLGSVSEAEDVVQKTLLRVHRTLADGWAYARPYNSETQRRDALPAWIHFYNHHRIHSAIGGTPTSRLNNLPGHHN